MSKIIDVHVHVGRGSGGKLYSPDDALRLMDQHGIDQAVISPVPDYEDPHGRADTAEQNDQIFAALKKWPDRFPRGFGVVEARHGEEGLPEVDRVMGKLGLCGLMFHGDCAGVSLDHPSTLAIVERAAQYKHTVILAHMFQHSILNAPFQLMGLADAFPELTFIAGNPMMTSTDSACARYVSGKCPNILFDTGWNHSHLWPLEKAVAHMGVEKLLFGSDSPYYSNNLDKAMVEWSNLTPEQKDAVFYGNARRVFGL